MNQSQIECSYFNRGFCRRGDTCRYRHTNKLNPENNNKIATKLNFNNDEELENALLHSNN